MPPERDDDHDEILRLRDRLHKLEGGQASHTWQLEDLREWRAQARTQIDSNAKRIDRLVTKDEMEAAVTEQLRKDKGLVLTGVQKLAITVVGVATLADSIKGLLS